VNGGWASFTVKTSLHNTVYDPPKIVYECCKLSSADSIASAVTA